MKQAFKQNKNLFLSKIPFNWNFLLFVGSILLCLFWLKTETIHKEAVVFTVIKILLQFAFFTILSLLVIGFITSWIAWKYTKRQIKAGKFSAQLSIEKEYTEADFQHLHIHLTPIKKPFLGFIKLRLMDEQDRFSKKYRLSNSNDAALKSVDGVIHWQTETIKWYQIQHITLYFEDFFQFISLSYKVPTAFSFYRKPLLHRAEIPTIRPSFSNELESMHLSRKKIKGELFQYKHFEDSDDIRRVVWKIFAKNRELVVRMPETQPAFASQILVLADFSCIKDVSEDSLFNVYFLNQYKNYIWSVLRALHKGENPICLIINSLTDKKTFALDQIPTALSAAEWTTIPNMAGTPVEEFALIITHPLSQLRQTWGQHPATVLPFSFSRNLPPMAKNHWLRRIFKAQKDDINFAINAKWKISALRTTIVENEKQIF